MPAASRLLVFFGHHRCATTWLSQRVLKQMALRLKLRWAYCFSPRQFDDDAARFVSSEAVELLCYVNAERRYAEQLPDHLGFHVVRDPRDLLVSSYYAHRYSHPTEHWPELPAHRARLASLSKGDGLLADMQFTTELPTDGVALRPLDALASWRYDQPHVLELRYEDIAADPQACVAAAMAHLGLLGSDDGQLTPRQLRRLVARNAFERVTGGRARGVEDVGHHYRRGVAGDWELHFEDRHKRAFKQRWGELLIRLGYESDQDW